MFEKLIFCGYSQNSMQIIYDNSQHNEVLLPDGCAVGVVDVPTGCVPFGAATTGYVLTGCVPIGCVPSGCALTAHKPGVDSRRTTDHPFQLCDHLLEELRSGVENEVFVGEYD